jgi:hypothetical protein
MRRGPGVLVNFSVGEKRVLSNQIFDVAKSTILTTLLLLTWCILSFPIVGLKLFPLATFALKSPTRNVSVRYLTF